MNSEIPWAEVSKDCAITFFESQHKLLVPVQRAD